MSKNGILHQGEPLSFRLFLHIPGVSGAPDVPVNWDLVTGFALRIYALSTNNNLKAITKNDLVITDPSSGIAIANVSSTETESPEDGLYVFEYKYKINGTEKGKKGYLGTFAKMKLSKTHF